jgi:cyclopropane fatty-acyl-phospholipid synthase-like methyltransferase
MQTYFASNQTLPCAAVPSEMMPGHWLLAKLGKRVLRPGGLKMTRWLLNALRISSADEVIEFAPGLGATAKMVIELHPMCYIGVERDQAAAAHVSKVIDSACATCIVGRADATELPSACATIVVAEAMLSMQPDSQKARIVAEARRLLRPNGRYAIHELCVQPADLPFAERQLIEQDLSQAIHAGVKLLTAAEWRQLLALQGFEVVSEQHAPMHLLRPLRVLHDEGLRQFVRFLVNVGKDRAARHRVRQMRDAFHRHRKHLSAIAIVAKKIEF